MHFNIRGLLCKLQQLRELISTISSNNIRIDAILLCETLLSDAKQTMCHIDGYTLITNNRNSRGGGLAILLRNDFQYHRLKDKEININKEFERLRAQTHLATFHASTNTKNYGVELVCG